MVDLCLICSLYARSFALRGQHVEVFRVLVLLLRGQLV